jgi:diacylglycerol kinase (ATP)
MILNKTTRVINVAGIGIDVDVLNRYYRMKRFKPKTRYKIATILQTLFFKWHKVLISIDDAPHIPIKTLLLSLGNGQSIGGGIKMCPQAKIDDDYLNLTYIGSFNRILALPKLKKVMKGKIEKLKCTKFYTCKKLSIILNGIGYQYDGNVVNNQNQVDICLANQKINFIG